MSASPSRGGVVRAAGGVVVRPDGTVAVVHRPKYDDWSLPKGKLEPGEEPSEGALREVEEETGTRCRLVRSLLTTEYTDHRGRPKVVDYWLMEVVDGDGEAFVPNDEVDEVRWLRPRTAVRLLTYERDRDLVRAVSRP
jgi:8-oxo-dGTP diphosphatase